MLADLAGDDAYHVGDEAMAEATIEWLRSLAPDGHLAVTVASSDPAATARRLGCDAVPWVGFAECTDGAGRRALARAADRPGSGAHPLVRAVADADALVIAGGGNLNSMWPGHVHERALAAAVAERAGLPVVVTGQTLGPFDIDADRAEVAQLLATASVVGVREPHSAAEARALGVGADRLVEAPDDAVFLTPEPPASLPAGFDPGTPAAPRRYVAVTVHPFAARGDERYVRLGHQLGELAERVAAQVLVVPHVRRGEGFDGMGDDEVATELSAHCGGFVLRDPTAREAVWASHNAWMVVSSRYHPIVFATAAAVPALALTWGHYTSVKCRGALGHAGVEPWWVDLEAAADGELAEAAAEVARRREELADWMAADLGALASRDAWRRWRIADALGFDAGPEPVVLTSGTLGRTDAPRPAGGWAARRA